MTHYYSIERLVHYQCGSCGGYWAKGDADTTREVCCPDCGTRAAAVEKPLWKPTSS